MSSPGGDISIQDLAEGREDAFAALYDRFGKTLYRTALTLLGSPSDAEDAVQEVFVGLVRARGALSKVDNLRAYLFASLRHAACRQSAYHKAERQMTPRDLADIFKVEPHGLDADRDARLERAVLNLPLEQRELVALKVDAGLTFAEIAGCLGISANTAASRYRYALEKLRAALMEECRECPAPDHRPC
jgi:RNA polymerase sigma-70 factor, ECF subfamily